MRITTLFGSAKKKGNTATVLGWVEEDLRSHGHRCGTDLPQQQIYWGLSRVGQMSGESQ
ncbi:MAG: hypothetical protein PVF32_07915 [Desulfobacterales bacterium]|jgi:hypothetical protein